MDNSCSFTSKFAPRSMPSPSRYPYRSQKRIIIVLRQHHLLRATPCFAVSGDATVYVRHDLTVRSFVACDLFLLLCVEPALDCTWRRGSYACLRRGSTDRDDALATWSCFSKKHSKNTHASALFFERRIPRSA
eukprot:GEMP01100361.1.p2 GENE.GEMP01100361.1~~GEMP01100361.1.p2  ORF type:complete len:133 (+),score=15.52 GEMP01100361.1:79-477(+)